MYSKLLTLLGLSMAFSPLVSSLSIEDTVSINKRLPSTVEAAGVQVTIDPNGAYVRVCHLSDGSLLAGYTVTSSTAKALPVSRSTDGGGTWNRIGVVVENSTSTAEIDNSFPLQLSNGRILFAYRNHDKNPTTGALTYYRITVSYSDDGGSTWAFLSNVDERTASTSFSNGLWEPFIRIAENGDIQVYYSSESAVLDQQILMKTSQDNGQTWSDSSIASTGATNDTRDGMAGVANIDNNGNLIMVFENTEIGPGIYSIDYVRSSDDGNTWNDRARLYTAPNNGNAGAPQILNVDGTLVASFQSTALSSDGKDEMLIVTSTDNGTTWNTGSPTIAATGGIYWPGMVNMQTVNFLALTGQGPLGATSQWYELV